METIELQQNLQRLDASAKGMWNDISNLNNQIAECEMQANQCLYMANMIMSSISEDDDYNVKMDQARSYMSQAEQYNRMAMNYENEVTSIKGELRNCIGQYEYYKGECENNIQNLNIAIQKLMAVPNSKYSGGVADALASAKQKLLQNNRYLEGCISRINSIQQICGSAGDSKQKVLKKY